MSNQVSAHDFSSMQALDREINVFIMQIEKGHVPNPSKLLQIEDALKSLVKNPNIPASVKLSLQSALQHLSTEDIEGNPVDRDVDLSSLYQAKQHVDRALEQAKLENRL